MAKIHLLFVRLVELGSHLHWFPLAIIQWPQWVTFPICHCEFILPYFPLPLLQGASICWPNNSGLQSVAFMYLSEQGRQVKVLLSAVLPGCRRHCSPSPFATIWGKIVCTKWLFGVWLHSSLLQSGSYWQSCALQLEQWIEHHRSYWNTDPFSGTCTGRGGNWFALLQVTSLQCYTSAAYTCLKGSWLLQPLLKTLLLHGSCCAMIGCHLLTDSNWAFERLMGQEYQCAEWDSLTMRFLQ